MKIIGCRLPPWPRILMRGIKKFSMAGIVDLVSVIKKGGFGSRKLLELFHL
jgi:hypothetical protein